jgi:hypothetical protein
MCQTLQWESGTVNRVEISNSSYSRIHLPNGLELKTKLRGLSPQANYTDRATAACRRSWCQLLLIEGATCSAWRIPTAVISYFWTGTATFSFNKLLNCTHESEWTPFQTHYSKNVVAPGIEPRPLDLWLGTLTTRPQRRSTFKMSSRTPGSMWTPCLKPIVLCNGY